MTREQQLQHSQILQAIARELNSDDTVAEQLARIEDLVLLAGFEVESCG